MITKPISVHIYSFQVEMFIVLADSMLVDAQWLSG